VISLPETKTTDSAHTGIIPSVTHVPSVQDNIMGSVFCVYHARQNATEHILTGTFN